MSTISNELVKDLRMAFSVWQQDYDAVEDKAQYEMFGLGVVAMDELLALRKERERSEPIAYADPQAFRNFKAGTANKEWMWAHPDAGLVPVFAKSTAALVLDDDSLPYDPQIAEYEQMMEAEQAQADTTSQQFESLAGKAVVPEGWKLVPVEPTIEMHIAFAEAWFSKVRCVDDCELEDAYIAMLLVAPEPCK
ncbi:hypothetical protein SM091_004236 [Cronobacter sakazakii]|nr:hypothetical protein [Cronobacter sakazakii]ELY4757321.1 hypothetical protein [Cronobacter sakazakii]ELY4769672.1 hypothetical protein [Cronobacter sakazakii]